jgi:hypothetical protein
MKKIVLIIDNKEHELTPIKYGTYEIRVVNGEVGSIKTSQTEKLE